MLSRVQQAFLPDAVILFHPEGEEKDQVIHAIPFIQNQEALNNQATAYICKNYACQEPTTDVERLAEQL